MLYEMFSVADPAPAASSHWNAGAAANHHHLRYTDLRIFKIERGTFSNLRDVVPDSSLPWCEIRALIRTRPRRGIVRRIW
jgi:hypothetical protein